MKQCKWWTTWDVDESGSVNRDILIFFCVVFFVAYAWIGPLFLNACFWCFLLLFFIIVLSHFWATFWATFWCSYFYFHIFSNNFNTYLRWSDSSLVDLFLAYGCSHLWLTLKLGTFLIIKVLWTYLKLSRCNVKPLPLEMMHCELVHKNQHRQKCPICSNLFCDHGKL